MFALIQRVARAHVEVQGRTVGAIDRGILALVGMEAADSSQTATRLLEKILSYRIFPDEAGKMNLSLQQIDGGLLLVPQFTLAADTRKGNRPSFSSAAPPEMALALFEVGFEGCLQFEQVRRHRHAECSEFIELLEQNHLQLVGVLGLVL